MIETINKILRVFERNNLFEEGVELIGSWCFSLYQKHLGAKKYPLATLDIDFLIPSPFYGKDHAGFVKQLEDLGFHVDFNKEGSLFLWSTELKIEFIAPEKSRGVDKFIKIKKLGLNAIPLRYVGFLLDEPITVIDDGIRIKVPSPERYCLHKLIVADKRKKIDKRLKDLQQAIYTFGIVDEKECRALFVSLLAKWKKRIVTSLVQAKAVLPLLKVEIEKFQFVLQNRN